MTANAMKSDIQLCLSSGMDDYISKPFKANDLLEIIAKWMKHIDQQTQNTDTISKDCETKASVFTETSLETEHSLDQLASDQKIKQEEVYEIYNEFVDMLPDYIAKIQEAIDIGNFDGIRMSSHTLKGAAATLRLKKLSEIAAELETKSKVMEMSICRIYLEQIIKYCQRNIKKVKMKFS